MAGNWGESAIRAFSTVSDVLNKRELLARDEADRKIKEEERIANKPILDETRKYNLDLLKQKRGEIFDSQTSPFIASAMDKTSKGIALDDAETGAILMATNRAGNWKDATPDQINERNRSLRLVGEKIKGMEPAILQAVQSKQPVNISRQSDPDLFNAFDKLPDYGGAANKGLAADGKPAKSKTLEQATITPEGNMILKLRVEQQDGTVYYAPVTVGRDSDPNAPVLQIPIAMFGAKLQQELKFADTLDGVMKQLGSDKFATEVVKKREGLKASEALHAGELAVHEYLAKNPEKADDVNAIRSAYTLAAREKAKEFGVTLSQTDLHNGAILYVQGKSSKGEILYNKEGQALSVDTQSEKDAAVLAGFIFKNPKGGDSGPKSPAERLVDMEPSKRDAVIKATRELEKPAAEKPPKPLTQAELTRSDGEYNKLLVGILPDYYPELYGTKSYGELAPKLSKEHKKAIDAGRKMLKEGSTPGEAADAVVEALGTPPAPEEEAGFWGGVGKVVGKVAKGFTRALSPPPSENKPATPGGPKTVKLPDGKIYKDGDTYIDPKTKQKSIVRVK